MDDCTSEPCLSLARRTCPVLASALLAAGVCLAGTLGSGKVTAVRFWSLGDVTRVAVEVSSGFNYKSDRLSEPDRLFFDIRGARPAMVSKGVRTIAVGDALVNQIRLAETQPGVTRVVLDLAQSVEFTASQLSSPDRLIIELRLKDHPARALSPSVTEELAKPEPVPKLEVKPEPRKFEPPPLHADLRPALPAPDRQPELLAQPRLGAANRTPGLPSQIAHTALALNRDIPPPPSPAASEARPETLPTPPPANTARAAEPSTEPLPAKRNASGGRSLTRVLGLKLGRVVLDPGHGGHDVGTHGPSGLLEKDLVLDVAQRLGALLEQRLGTEVIYTRSDDTFIPLEDRTQIANDHKADLFLSIHANSSPFRYAAGVETYYLNFTTSRAALDVAARENASSDRSVFDLQDLLKKIALKDKIDESREFALRLQTALYGVSAKGNMAAKNRGVKKAPFVVLIGASMPSVLAEIGFLTNSADETLLRKPEHRQKIAEALYRGIANYADTLSHFQVAERD